MSSLPVREHSRWFSRLRPNPQAKLRLFCFPYAGGGPALFRDWEQDLPGDVEVCSVQLPGRGSRFKEKPYSHMPSLISEVAQAIRPYLDLPFSFFGHSLGAFISFELAHRLKMEFARQPEHLFVSACRGPHVPRTLPNIHHLPDEQFITELRALNGTPREVLEDPDLMQLMMGTLRADFALAEGYECSATVPLSCPITAFAGLEDTLAPKGHLEEWQIHTTGSFDLWLLPGDHFFLHNSDPMLLQILRRELNRGFGG